MSPEDQARAMHDLKRLADACETANGTSAAHLRVAEDLRELHMKRYEYERLNQNIFDERQRAARHHDVLCLVLQELMRGNSPWPDNKRVNNFIEAVEMAEYAADLAYPPPKEQA